MLLSRRAKELIRRSRLRNVRSMSLNGTERILFDYIIRHADERHFWEEKVRDLTRVPGDDFAISRSLANALRSYHDERCRAGSIPADAVDGSGLNRLMLINLAEHLIRIWGPVRPSRRRGQNPGDEIP